jgi:hypothetical protein
MMKETLLDKILAALCMFAVLAAVYLVLHIDDRQVLPCDTDTECMQLNGGDGGPQTLED